jgi:hypothetical protein
LTRTPTIKFDLKVGFRQRNEWWAAVDDNTDSASVGFAEG